MLSNRTILKPDGNTLISLFGDTNPISHYAESEYNEKMISAISTEEKITVICDYAERLHKAQYDYDQISPYGGYDITVQMIDEIALNEVLKMYEGDALSEACALLRNELNSRNISLIYTEGIIKTYQDLQKLPQKLEKQYADYQITKAEFEQNVQAKMSGIQKHGELEYSKYEKKFDEFQSSPIRRFLGKIPGTKTHEKLTAISDALELALSDMSISKQTVIEKFFKEDDNPMYSAPFYYTPIESDNAEMKLIETESDLKAAITEIREQLTDPNNQTAYNRCLFFYDIPISNVVQKEQSPAIPNSKQKNDAKNSKYKNANPLPMR